MSFYSVLVANEPLPTINCTGITEITVREYKKMYPEQECRQMDDDALILLAPDPLAFSKLRIFEWDNFPYDLNEFSEKPYVYGIEGAWDSQFLIDLLNYLKESIKKEQGTELIRFWAGVYNQELKKRHITIETLELQHLESFSEEPHLRISFE